MGDRTTGNRLAAGMPSRTALGAAMHRARHQILDDPPVFLDPLAVRIVGPDAEAGIRAGDADAGRPLRRALRAFIAVRARFAEDALRQALDQGVSQVVVLGAGLDTLAYRERLPPGARVYEVDHPATQAWKRRLLRDAGIVEPPTVHYLEADFETATLEEVLAASPLDPAGPVFVTWLGVTPYLTRPAIAATLRTVAAWPAGSELVFDYGAMPGEALRATATADQARAMAVAIERMAALGEPWITFFEPGELDAELRSAGFTAIEDLDGSAIDARYFVGRRDGLHVSPLSHLVDARSGRT